MKLYCSHRKEATRHAIIAVLREILYYLLYNRQTYLRGADKSRLWSKFVGCAIIRGLAL